MPLLFAPRRAAATAGLVSSRAAAAEDDDDIDFGHAAEARGRAPRAEVALLLDEARERDDGDDDHEAGGLAPLEALLAPPAAARRGRVRRACAAGLLIAAAAVAGFVCLALVPPSAAPRAEPSTALQEVVQEQAISDACESCPTGSCDRGPTGSGPCVWYAQPVDIGAYHCRVDWCGDVPIGEHFSACWEYDGTLFYSMYMKSAECDKTSTSTSTTTTPQPPPTTTTTPPPTTTTVAIKEQEIFEMLASDVEETPDGDPMLTAYWDIGTCGVMGEAGDDHHSEWCGGLVAEPSCADVVDAPFSSCNSGKAKLQRVRGRTWIDHCEYMYFAQYRCQASTTTTSTSTSSSTTVTTTSITSTSSTTTTSTTTSTTTTTTTSATTTTTSISTTSTNEFGTCAQPPLGPEYDTSDCAGLSMGGTCLVKCATSYEGDATKYECKSVFADMEGEPPACTSSTTTTANTTRTTSTTTSTFVMTTHRLEGEMAKNMTAFEYRVGRWGRWTDEAGFPSNCNDGFKLPKAPKLATDFNGIHLPPVCFKKKGPHRVYVTADWGGVLGPEGPKPANHRHDKHLFINGTDDSAQLRVAAQMRERAKTRPPDYFLNGGDNFYWAGLDTQCGLVPAFAITPTGQFEHVFEGVYTGAGIDGKPWLSVLGNHDYGGYMFNKGWDQQIAYTWGPGGRWIMPAQYWSTKVYYPGFSIDYIFVDTNVVEAKEPHADPEHNICSKAHINVTTATCHELGPEDVWDCPRWFKKMWDQQVPWIEKRLNDSTATWQIVVTHFPPTWKQDFWMDMAKKYGIDLFVTGHMHLQEFNYISAANFLYPTAWLVSGGGGGITSEGVATKDGWDDQYGFFELTFTKDVIEIICISHGGFIRSQNFVTPRHRGEERALPGRDDEVFFKK